MTLTAKIRRRLRIWASYVAMVLAGLISFLFFRFPFNFAQVRGRHNIPRRGKGVLFVSNHHHMIRSSRMAAYFPQNNFYPRSSMNPPPGKTTFAPGSRPCLRCCGTVLAERRITPADAQIHQFLKRHNLLIFTRAPAVLT